MSTTAGAHLVRPDRGYGFRTRRFAAIWDDRTVSFANDCLQPSCLLDYPSAISS